MLYIYTTTNPCLCSSSSGVNPVDDCNEECNCLHLCHIAVNANSDLAVGPCGAEGTIDVTDAQYGHDFCACGDEPGYWSVVSFDNEIFVSASIGAETGVLTWNTQGADALSTQYGNIILKYCCGPLSAYMTVLIGIKDLCQCPTCGTCDNCDPCTGICLDGNVDISLGGE